MDILDLDRRALAAAGEAVAAGHRGPAGGPTPCRDWTLRDLLSPHGGHNHGFAAAARGEIVPAAAWDGRPAVDDPYPAYAESAQAASDAFAAPGALDRQIELPGLGTFPLRIAIGFHFVDYLIHGWDVARATGAPRPAAPDPGSELTATALKFAVALAGRTQDARARGAVRPKSMSGRRPALRPAARPARPAPTGPPKRPARRSGPGAWRARHCRAWRGLER